MEQFLRQRTQVAGALFGHFDGAPLTRYQFTSALKCLARLGIDYNSYTCHFSVYFTLFLGQKQQRLWWDIQ